MSAADEQGAPTSGSQQTLWARVPLYPVIFAVALIFVGYVDSDISVFAALRPLLVVLGASIVITSLAALAVRNLQLGGLIAAGLMLILRASDVVHGAQAVGLILLVGIALFWFARLRRAAMLPSATRLLNVMSLALAAIIVGQALLSGIPGRIAADVQLAPGRAPAPGIPTTDPPDIYLLMLEDYPRADALVRRFGFDNSAFLNDLRARGFTVSTQSRSNYVFTSLNVSALFQMQYLGDVRSFASWQVGQGPRPYLQGIINHNPALDLLHGEGYTIYSSATRWETPSLRSADVFCASGQINEFEFQRIQDSLLGVALDALMTGWQADRDRSVVQAELACTASQIQQSTSGPRFVFAHIEAPHIPVVFDEAGRPAPRSVYSERTSVMQATPREFATAYVAQLRYINARVLDLLGRIRNTARRPPIVIVMSDEGYNTDAAQPQPSDLQDRFGSLFAAATPDHPGLFGDAPMPVNLFPTLFNAYFRTSLATHSARFFTSSSEDPLRLAEVRDPFGPIGP